MIMLLIPCSLANHFSSRKDVLSTAISRRIPEEKNELVVYGIVKNAVN